MHATGTVASHFTPICANVCVHVHRTRTDITYTHLQLPEHAWRRTVCLWRLHLLHQVRGNRLLGPARVYASIFVCVRVRALMCTGVSKQVRTQVRNYACRFAYNYTCVHSVRSLCVYVHVQMNMCVYKYMYIHTQTHTKHGDSTKPPCP